MDELKTLESLGFALPSLAYIFGAILFSLIGWVAYRYGKKFSLTPCKRLGITLMFYPYAITDTRLLYGIGVALCFGVYWYRK
jgi:hypothetical protein